MATASLTLRRPAPHSTGEPWADNDYEVHDAEGCVGRIVLTTANYTGGRELPWFWSITCKFPNEPADRGNAASLEDAKRAFKSRWLVVSAKGRPHLP